MIQFNQKGILFAEDVKCDVILHIHQIIPVVKVALPKKQNKQQKHKVKGILDRSH